MVYLSGSAPRRTPAQKFARILIGVAAVGLICWGLASIPYDILRAERARLFGEDITSGLVLDARTVEDPDYPQASLVIEYKYADPDGFTRRAQARLPNGLWRRYRPGSVVKVLLVRGRPELSRLPDEVEPAFQVWLRDLMN
ncbi:hypothetical protein LF599_05125 [Pseudodesulfovibrio thermohalotolerans]|uniref:hypothetical protein n=1 Tax=Pseudodesulfovibrio thermohalotolerans TaxID=2880651 RepID=UPI002443565A|nr:hypothetical protein [Pseudodesulfovibrio thermohalotolerans]WFS63549.1 hypothetical protein LF599_05125 [Pseudodesulfovibrio thermohalotolerans]